MSGDEEAELPYGGSYYRASLVGDYKSAREIMLYKNSYDVFPSLPDVEISKDKCEIEIAYLDKRGTIERTVCIIKKRFSLGNTQYFGELPVYKWDNSYHANTSIIKNGKFVAIPLSDDVYYLVSKKSFEKDDVETCYSVYTDIYWYKHGHSASMPYSKFEKLSMDEIIDVILNVND